MKSSGRAMPIASEEDPYAGRFLGAIAARWDDKAKDWDKNLQDAACHLNEDQAYARFVRQLQRLVGQRRTFCARHGVIEAGCGTGLVLEQVSRQFAWALGVDISPAMVRMARRKKIPQTRFVVGDAFNLTRLSEPAGAVCSRGVLLSHYGARQGTRLLKAAHAALVPGGLAVYDFLNQAARGLHRHAPEHKAWFTRRQACELARRAGFRRVRVLGAEVRRVLLLVAVK